MIGPCCLVKFDHEGTPKGKYIKVNSLDAYIAGDEYDSDKVVVFSTDIFGHELSNTQLVADDLAKMLEAKVIVPDIIEGDALFDFSKIPEWIEKHPVEAATKYYHQALEGVKAEYKSSKIYGIGFCYGATPVLVELVESGLLDGGNIVHASVHDTDLFPGVTKPLSISVGLEDVRFDEKLRNEAIEIMEKKDVRFEFNLFKGAPHGYQIKGDISIPSVRYAKEKTLIDQAFFFASL